MSSSDSPAPPNYFFSPMTPKERARLDASTELLDAFASSQRVDGNAFSVPALVG